MKIERETLLYTRREFVKTLTSNSNDVNVE